jgi:hypothetical protein
MVALLSVKIGCWLSLPPAQDVPTVTPPQSTVALLMTLPAAQELGGTVELEVLEEAFDELVLDVAALELLEDELLGVELLTELLELVAVPEGTEHSLVPPATLPPKVASLQTKLPVSVL